MWTELNRFVLSLCTRAQIKKDEGQALVEYTLILALVSIVAICPAEPFARPKSNRKISPCLVAFKFAGLISR